MGRPKNFNRIEVMEKAMPLFWKRGFADTGLQDLEKATGVNKSGLYSEFKNKEDLYLATLRHYTETRKARELLSEAPLGWGNIERFLKLKLAAKGAMKGCFAVNSMREIALLPAEAQEIVTGNRAHLKQLFHKNIAAEKTRLAPEALVEVLSTFFSGLCIEQNLKPGRITPEQKTEDFLRALRAM
jgi:TetR/AcrR family transcriptional regulator, copper-responsive repressor